MTDMPQEQNWRLLAERASQETDPTRLMEIITALTSLLEKEQEGKQQARAS
jgi:hypothetical protein